MKMLRYLIIASVLVSKPAGAFLECRDVQKTTVCNAGEQRHDYKGSQYDPKTKKPKEVMVYRCCKDTCKQ